MNILITGGSGFIGNHTVQIGRSVGHEITNLDISDNSDISENIVNVDWSEFGLRNYDAVIHLAALVNVPESFDDPSRYHEVNVEATRRLFMSCVESGIKKVIFSSSAAVYSTLEIPIILLLLPIQIRKYWVRDMLEISHHLLPNLRFFVFSMFTVRVKNTNPDIHQ